MVVGDAAARLLRLLLLLLLLPAASSVTAGRGGWRWWRSACGGCTRGGPGIVRWCGGTAAGRARAAVVRLLLLAAAAAPAAGVGVAPWLVGRGWAAVVAWRGVLVTFGACACLRAVVSGFVSAAHSFVQHSSTVSIALWAAGTAVRIGHGHVLRGGMGGGGARGRPPWRRGERWPHCLPSLARAWLCSAARASLGKFCMRAAYAGALARRLFSTAGFTIFRHGMRHGKNYGVGGVGARRVGSWSRGVGRSSTSSA